MSFEANARITPRELLASVAGSDHELHSPVAKARSKSTITLTCSCGKVFAVANTPEHLHILRNIEL